MVIGDVLFFWVALFSYLAATVLYFFYLGVGARAVSRIGLAAMIVGFAALTAGSVLRGVRAGYVPLTNLYEYVVLLAWAISLFFFLARLWMKSAVLDALIAPAAFLMIVIASLFPKEATDQLVPALQSHWLQVHVSLAILGEGAFAVAFVAAVLYLLKRYNPGEVPAGMRLKAAGAFLGCLAVGFVVGLASLKGGAPDEAADPVALRSLGMGLLVGLPLFALVYWAVKTRGESSGFGAMLLALISVSILLGGTLVGIWQTASDGVVRSGLGFLGLSAVLAVPFYALLVLIRGRLAETLPGLDVLDRLSYKAITIGYPLFTIGALLAGAIWAYSAWGSVWSWDPKETGSLIIWLIYSAYLHTRLLREWRGSRAAMLAVLGFCAALASLFGNMVLSGLHSYGSI